MCRSYLIAMVVTTWVGMAGLKLGMPFTKSVIGTVPVGAFAGICTFTCHSPTYPGARLEAMFEAGTWMAVPELPRSTWGRKAVGNTLVVGAGWPSGGAFGTNPCPVPYSCMVWPRAIGL